jgi:hypothetical protein
MIGDMISSKLFKANEIARAVNCSSCSVYTIKSNIQCFGSTKASSNGDRQPQSVTPLMLDTLCKHLFEKPSLCQNKIILFLLDKFNTQVLTFSIERVLRSIG